MFLDELQAVSDKDRRHLGELRLLLAVEETVVEGECEFLQDGEEDPVVQGEIAVGVAEDQPAGQGSVGSSQFALNSVLGQDQHGLSAELSIPGEGGSLKHSNINININSNINININSNSNININSNSNINSNINIINRIININNLLVEINLWLVIFSIETVRQDKQF